MFWSTEKCVGKEMELYCIVGTIDAQSSNSVQIPTVVSDLFGNQFKRPHTTFNLNTSLHIHH